MKRTCTFALDDYDAVKYFEIQYHRTPRVHELSEGLFPLNPIPTGKMEFLQRLKITI